MRSYEGFYNDVPSAVVDGWTVKPGLSFTGSFSYSTEAIHAWDGATEDYYYGPMTTRLSFTNGLKLADSGADRSLGLGDCRPPTGWRTDLVTWAPT